VIRFTPMTPFALAAILLVSNLSSNWARRTLGPDRPMRPASEARASAPLPASSRATLRLETAETGNEVRYRVRERLVELDMPNDAIGRTGAVTGAITFDSAGRVIPSASHFTAEVTGLTSDRDRRDRYVRERILEADEHPVVELAPTAIRGVTLPLQTSGTGTFELLGNLTVKGVTRPTVWKVDAQFSPSGVTGTAATAFTFEDFGLTQPRVPVLLSVADTIRLEYAFRLVTATSPNHAAS
jgi:polyisoprenoid-binding protein YceI